MKTYKLSNCLLQFWVRNKQLLYLDLNWHIILHGTLCWCISVSCKQDCESCIQFYRFQRTSNLHYIDIHSSQKEEKATVIKGDVTFWTVKSLSTFYDPIMKWCLWMNILNAPDWLCTEVLFGSDLASFSKLKPLLFNTAYRRL